MRVEPVLVSPMLNLKQKVSFTSVSPLILLPVIIRLCVHAPFVAGAPLSLVPGGTSLNHVTEGGDEGLCEA